MTNACGGCTPLGTAPGAACGSCGTWACTTAESVSCGGEHAPNACGGCTTLNGTPGNACGTCGTTECVSEDALACTGEHALNACGGCATLAGTPGQACGQCGTWQCRAGNTGVLDCINQHPSNACGGCSTLSAVPGTSCGACGTMQCQGMEAVACSNPSRVFEMTATWAQLAAQHGSCVPGAQMSLMCLAAMRRMCLARAGCSSGTAWGPYGVDANGMAFSCFVGGLKSTPATTVAAGCPNVAARSIGCAETVHGVCWNQHGTAIGAEIQEYGGGNAFFGCVDQVVTGFAVSRADIAALVSTCGNADLYSPPCFTGIKAYCQARSFAGAVGPLTPGPTAGTRYIGCFH